MAKRKNNSTPGKEAFYKAKKELGERLIKFRESVGVIERSDFAKILEIQYFTLLGYERGRTEPHALFYKMLREKYPFVDICYIITGHHTQKKGFEDSEHIPLRRIPVVDHIPLKGFPDGIPKSYIVGETFTTNLDNSAAFAFLVRGNRFLPEAKQGDYLILVPVTKTTREHLYIIHEDSKETVELAGIDKSGEGFRVSPVQHERPPYSTKDLGSVFQVVEIYRNLL